MRSKASTLGMTHREQGGRNQRGLDDRRRVRKTSRWAPMETDKRREKKNERTREKDIDGKKNIYI